MNIKAISAAVLFAALNVGAVAAHADVKTEAYTYGTHLDIQKVVSRTMDSSPDCEPVNTHITYLDSKGETRGLSYLTFADSCNQGG